MKKTIALLFLGLALAVSSAQLPVEAEFFLKQENPSPLVITTNQSESLGVDEQLWGNAYSPGDKQALLRSINHSLRYLSTGSAQRAYANYPVPGVSRDRVRRSLIRFRQLLLNSTTPQQLQAAVEREFVFYQSVGRDNAGTVFFTGYFEPTYKASRTPTAEYRYPLYRKPSNLDRWQTPHPSRLQLEGNNGLLGSSSPLAGYELVWLRDRLEAFLVQIQGSAQLQLTDGSTMTVGYAGNTDYPYTSIGRELVKDGKLPLDGLTLPVLINYFQTKPEELDIYLPRNNRFIFFQETHGAAARGSIGVPVTAERSIATDKSLMPPGALAFIRTRIPYVNQAGKIESPLVSRYVLDQDTGSAIKTPGRVDIFMGTGKVAGDRAGVVGWTGSLYYPLLKR